LADREECPKLTLGYNGSVLKKIRLKNFKLHENTSIEASPITVFIGPNNSGKSSVFQALLGLQQAASQPQNQFYIRASFQRQTPTENQPFLFSPSLYPKATVDLGEFPDVVRGGSGELQIGLDAKLAPQESSSEAGRIDLSFDLLFRDNRLARHDGHLSCSRGSIKKWGWAERMGPASPTVQMAVGGPVALEFRVLDNLSMLAPAGMSGLPGPTQPPAFVALQRTVAEAPARLLQSFRYVSPLRGFEEWAYPTTESPAREELDHLVLSDRAVALTNLLAANVKLRSQISERLRSLIGIGMEFETAPFHRVKVWASSAKSGAPETLFVNEGSGANQLPFILVPIALAEPADTVLLGEPEAHLHPKMQSDLSGAIVRASKERELQFFIETHSEHILHRFLHSVAKGELAHEDLSIYYFENKDGRAEAKKLRIDEKGGVEGGLPGFFDQSLDELTEYLEVLKQPKA
jgi:predicted ATPase